MALILTRCFFVLALCFIIFKLCGGDKNLQEIKIQHNSKNHPDGIVLRLNQIEKTLVDLKDHLIHHQMEYVKPIKEKINFLKKVSDVFRQLTDGVPINRNVNIVANNVRINQNTQKNIIGKIQLNTAIHRNKVMISMLEKLRARNIELKSQIEHQIRKRSLMCSGAVEWTGTVLHIDRLSLLDHRMKPIDKQNAVHNLLGKLTLNRLIVNKLVRAENETSNWNKKRTKRTLPSLDHPKIVVESINFINWNGFLNTVFRKQINMVIAGNLFLSKSLNTVELIIDEMINGSLLTELMTLSTDQIIESNVYISHMELENVHARIFNGMKYFAENVVVLGADNVIESPVKISVCTIDSQLQLSDDEGENMTEHIVGTHIDDLTQIYHGKIVIKGSTDVSNIYTSQEYSNGESQIHVNGAPVDLMNISQQYWMKKISQELKHVVFNQPVTSTQATVALLNGTSISQYFSVLDDATVDLPINVEFGAAVAIQGNLFSDQSSPITTLQKLSSEAVTRLGSTQVTMDSPIIFKGQLLVNRIEMQMDTSNLIQKSPNGTIEHGNVIRKQFQRLITSSNIIIPHMNGAINIQNFNGLISLKDRLDSIIITTLDKLSTATFHPQPAVIFETVCAANVVNVENANLIHPDQHDNDQNNDINTILQDVFSVREHHIQSLFVDGYVMFDRIPKNSTHIISIFNGLDFNKYMKSVILPPGEGESDTPHKSFEIAGKKSFISELNIKSAHTININKRIQTSDWLESAVRTQQQQQQMGETSAQQTIESPGWQFIDVTSDNFDIKNAINGIQVVSNDDKTSKSIIFIDDDSSNTLTIVSDLSISNDVKINSNGKLVSTELRPCNILTLIPSSVHLAQKYWNEITIMGNVKIISKESDANDMQMRCKSPLCYFEMALSSGTEESIDKNILFNLIDTHDKFSFNQIIQSSNSPSVDQNTTTLMNNINLIEIFSDAVTRATSDFSDIGQTAITTFTVPKKFIGTETDFVSALDALASNEFNVNLINNINPTVLNRTLYLRSTSREMVVSAWQKFLFLDSPVARTITLPNQSINGVDVSTILFAYTNQTSSLSFQTRINGPYISSETIYVSLVNGVSFEFFIDNRCKLLYKTSKPQTIEGYYTFDNLILTGEDVIVQQINDVSCDEIVLRHSNEKQLITGDKRIDGYYSQLFIEKPFHCWKANEFEIVELFAKSILLSNELSIETIKQQRPYQMQSQRAYIHNFN